MGWVFNPPTVDDGPRWRLGADQTTERLFRHFVGPTRGRTVLKSGSSYVTSDAPYLDDLLAADAVYYGGHVYEISEDERTDLIAAGFGDYIQDYDPVGAIGWAHAFWVEGSEFSALGLDSDDPVASFPDEVGDDDLAQGTAVRQFKLGTEDDQPALVADSGDGYDYMQVTFAQPIPQPTTIVVIGGKSNDGYLVDGVGSARQVIYDDGSEWAIWAGSGEVTGGSRDEDKHLFLGFFQASESELEIDGGSVTTGNTGTGALGGLTLAANRTGASNYSAEPISFVGVYAGDVRDEDGWTEFKSWAASHYGLTVL